MYAIVDIAGQQFKVAKEQEIFVHRLESEEGANVEFEKVLLIDNEGKVVVGTPHISGALIKAKVVSHLKGDKVLVFKKKRRKGYKKLNGHRDYLTQIVVEDIIEKAVAKKATKATPKKEDKVAEAKPKEEKPAKAVKEVKKEEVKAEKKAKEVEAKAKEVKEETKKEPVKETETKKNSEDKKQD